MRLTKNRPSSQRQSAGPSPLTKRLATVIVVLAVCWTGYRFGVLRAAANEILVEAQRLQGEHIGLKGAIEAYEAGFLRRPIHDFQLGFLGGSEWMSDTTELAFAWESPSDGLYMVVDWDCAWSQSAIDAALAIAERGGREVILLDRIPDNGPRWRGKYPLATKGLRVVTPTGGWWSVGLPHGVTPVWFAVAGGQFVAINVGAKDLETFAFDPAAPNVTATSDPVHYDPMGG